MQKVNGASKNKKIDGVLQVSTHEKWEKTAIYFFPVRETPRDISCLHKRYSTKRIGAVNNRPSWDITWDDDKSAHIIIPKMILQHLCRIRKKKPQQS